MDEQLLGWWLCERQCDSGGLNGRPEKQVRQDDDDDYDDDDDDDGAVSSFLIHIYTYIHTIQADVCYSWWILSSLSILGKVDWINKSKLQVCM